MKVSLFPDHQKEELRTTMPLLLTIQDSKKKSLVYLKEMSTGIRIKLSSTKSNIKNDPKENREEFHFYTIRPGFYRLQIDGDKVQEISLEIKEQKFLNFSQEFGFFTLLFSLVMGGLILWVYRLMKKKN